MTPSYEALRALVHAWMDDPTWPVAGPPYRVHETAEVAEDGSQACARCGQVLLLPALPIEAAFPAHRRVVEIPDGFALVTPDRLLAPDERPCR